MTLTLQDIIDTCKAEALAFKFAPSEESEWRWYCRQYAIRFYTPLHLVLKMNPEEVFRHWFESELDKVNAVDDAEDLLEKVYLLEDSEYDAKKEEDLQDFMKMAEQEEAERVAQGRPVHNKKTGQTALPKSPQKDLPTQGYLNLSYLEEQDKEE